MGTSSGRQAIGGCKCTVVRLCIRDIVFIVTCVHVLYCHSMFEKAFTFQGVQILCFPLHSVSCRYISILYTCCGSLVVMLSLSIREVMSSSSAWAGRVKPKTFKIGSDCSFAKSTALKESSLLKAVSAKHRTKFAALSPVMVTVPK
jgi:hypothetical protein